jgi:adenine-specific DNA-methyltransferase
MATDRSKARIFPEEYHLEELERRLVEEESAFSERIRKLTSTIQRWGEVSY